MTIALESVWQKIIEKINAEESGPSKMFMGSIKPDKLENNILTMVTVNEFCRDFVNKRYEKVINQILKEFDPVLNYEIIVKAGKTVNKPSQPSLPTLSEPATPVTKTPSSKYDSMFNSKYTFDSFVVGKSNQFAYAVCQGVTKNPGVLHNPVFIYGGVGLGKTHLIQAIGHEIIKNDPKAKIAYLSSESFTNEFIDSLREKKTDDFRKKYRKIDLLLIDDVQFFAKKEQTQEEFFHTFNELFQQKKQIVLTSDTSPDKIPDVDERLASRFAMGVVVDIKPPDLETRTAILMNCAKKSMVDVPEDVIMYIAQGVTSNIRALEGAFSSVLAYAGVMNKPINKDLVDQVLKDVLRETAGGKISISWIIKRVAEFYDITEAEMVGKRRSADLVLPRQVAMRLCQIFTEASLNQIGEKFGGRDHTTVMHACDKVNKMIKNDKNFSEEFERIKRFVDPNK
jgi:chromosomal replication initiator protein